MRRRVSIIHSKQGICPKNAVLRLRTSVLVIEQSYSPEYYLPQPPKLLDFGAAPIPLIGTLAPKETGTNNTIGMVRECKDVQRRGSTGSAACKTRGRREDTHLEETLDFFSSRLKRSMGHTDHVGRCIIVRKDWRDNRGSALGAHIRRQPRRKARDRPRHRQQLSRVNFPIAH